MKKFLLISISILSLAIAPQALAQQPIGNFYGASGQGQDAPTPNTIYVRNFQGNRAVLLEMLAEGLDRKGLTLAENQAGAEYVLDLALTQVTQGQTYDPISVYKRWGNVSINPSSGTGAFLVSVITWKDGLRVRELSTTKPITVQTNSGSSTLVSVKGFTMAPSSYSYSDGYTLAAVKAIKKIYGL